MRFCLAGFAIGSWRRRSGSFLLSGFSRVLMDDLARELGMSKKTLYSHFASKEDLLRAVLVQPDARGGTGFGGDCEHAGIISR